RELELDQADEELDRHHKEAQHDDEPCDQQDHDLDEVLEEAGEAEQPGDEVEDRLAGVDADLGKMAGLEGRGLAERAPTRLEPQACERIENDLGQVVEVAEDEGEDTDI